MTDQPIALRLANLIDHGNDSSWIEREAAAELRRLVAENTLLHERHHFDNGVLKELLEALKLAQSIIGHPEDAHSKLIAAAIAKAEA